MAEQQVEGAEVEGAGKEPLPKYTWEEIAKHRNAKSLWVVVHDKVYDITRFMEEVRVQWSVPLVLTGYPTSVLAVSCV